jgi:hypothetical protein
MGKKVVYTEMPSKPRVAKCAWAQAQKQFGKVSSIYLEEVSEEGSEWVVDVSGTRHRMPIQKIDQVFTVYRLDAEDVFQALKDYIFQKSGELIPGHLPGKLVWDESNRAMLLHIRQPGELANEVESLSSDRLN